jgi:hypothetical protein
LKTTASPAPTSVNCSELERILKDGIWEANAKTKEILAK